MASHESNLADRTGNLFESHKGYDPRIRLFYFLTAALIVVLTAGLAYQQILKTDIHHERERVQNQRRILIPGPRGNIYDRNGRVLVRNRPRLAVVVYLDELRREMRREFIRIRKNYRETGDKDLPSDSDMSTLARVSVVQSYLDQINAILHTELKVDVKVLQKHFASELALPFTLVDDLQPADYARLIERLPVQSPLQVYTSNKREYPFGSAAAHVIGYVGAKHESDTKHDANTEEETETKEEEDDFATDKQGYKLKTFKVRGSVGREGLERTFDKDLQGESGGKIFRVDPAGYKLADQRDDLIVTPKQGKNLVTSLDIDLQLAAEKAIKDLSDEKGEQAGSAVAIDVKTGEVLALARNPNYDLNDTSPHISDETYKDIKARDALLNYTIGGAYPPGSTFKILVSIAALRNNMIKPDEIFADCEGTMKIGTATKGCDNGLARHGAIALPEAIGVSCDIFFYTLGLKMGPDLIAAEARRFHFGERTGIELPLETTRMTVPDPAWKQRTQGGERWFPGDTANMAIGQGYVLVTPLEMACFAASVARDEVYTKPTLLHDPARPPQHTERIGLTPVQRAALIEGMIGCTTPAYPASTAAPLALPLYKIPGVQIAGKTGTAQKRIRKGDVVGNINYAWFICFAPAEKPEIAIAVMLEGDKIGESFGGGANAGPVAVAILKKYFAKQANPGAVFQPFKTAGN